MAPSYHIWGKCKGVIARNEILWGDGISAPQFVVLKCLYGLPLSREEKSIWRKYAGTRIFARYSPREFREAVLLIGRQAGKSTVIGTTVCLWESLVVPPQVPTGERFTALILTPTLRQSTFGKVAEKLRSIPELAELIEADAESQGLLCLRNGIDIQAVSAVPRFAERTGDGNRFNVSGRRNSKDDLAVAAVLSVSMAAERLERREPMCETIFVAPGAANTGNWDEDRFFVSKERIPSFARRRY